jgi:hypothetical protein
MTPVVPNEPANERSADVVNAGISRRGVIRAAGPGALALGLSGAAAAAQAASAAARTSPGRVSGAPQLPTGFWNTFTSRYVNADGLHQHMVIGGDGPPLLLVHGWPQTWYQWRLVMPTPARQFTVIAPDQRGRGLTGIPDPGPDGTGRRHRWPFQSSAPIQDAFPRGQTR